jgi:hypothetical protein
MRMGWSGVDVQICKCADVQMGVGWERAEWMCG